MPDYGLLIKNVSGGIQIDSKSRNLSLDQSGSGVTISNNNTTDGYYTRINITASPLVPLVLIRPSTDDFAGIRSYYKSGSNFAGIDATTMQNQNTLIDLKTYRENITPSAETHGLRVYNSGGNLCFDSGKSYFKIFSVHTINLAAPSNAYSDLGPYTDIIHSGISNPFYILSPNSFWVLAEPPAYAGPLRMYMIGMKKLTATSVRIGWFACINCLHTYTTPLSGGNNPTMKLIVCAT